MFGGYSENPYPYLKQAAVFVLSSRSEGMPNAMIEALSAGTSVVSTDIPNGPAEILENGRWGRLVPVGDDTAMATAIEQAMDDPISVPADDPWWRRFSETEITQQYMKILLPNRTSVQ